MALGILALEMATGMQRLICSAKVRSYEDAVLPCGPLCHLTACPCWWNLTTSLMRFLSSLLSQKVWWKLDVGVQ